ncbi:hypothetical protein OQJ46_11015 [Microbulbifer thermotolerans]|uniref:hypothetical protein n=1 Tax=Microbulbifer thermotolerans TaxID=252514 RepID=UPI00224878DD|nr:hypothetical protein [Microbulbifer thermotolerans]MCX2783514.1 hypothetical protein [Microbulbifer thermotolerans]MCX2795908.1 hypothetical protein [Microbulbifer thermotolerans]MCX2835566.1 hypothetical protein [Microbulbifer thermotolerans]WKT59778.1 hypothetical protein Q2E61_12850 [Microbulbifer thermotolerans]
MKTQMKLTGSVGFRGQNFRDDVRLVQELLNRATRVPWTLLAVDGLAGPNTINRIKDFQRNVVGFSKPDGRVDVGGRTWRSLARYAEETPAHFRGTFSVHPTETGVRAAEPAARPATDAIAWGAKVSPAFKRRVREVAANLGISPDFLMSCMAFETGETFSPSIKNAAGSGATGLIQFMPRTAKGLGTTTEALAKMTAEKQLDYVEKYFLPYKGKLKTLEDIYMAILYPAAIGMDPAAALFRQGSKTYEQNSGFDKNKDGVITPAEISVKVRQKYEKGLQKGYLG